MVVLSGLLNAAAKVAASLPPDSTAATPTAVLVSMTSALCGEDMRASEHPVWKAPFILNEAMIKLLTSTVSQALRYQLLAVASNMMRWLGPRWEGSEQ